jgi:hypothetical protein
VWENRKIGDVHNDCLSSVDGVNCKFQQVKIPDPEKPGKMKINKAIYSYKPGIKGAALRYEVGMSLQTSDIVWIAGPYAPGDWNDIESFRHGLLHELEEGERCEGDDGYIGEAPRYIKCPAGIGRPDDEIDMRLRVQGRHETINKRLKFFQCLLVAYKGKGTSKIEDHGQFFDAVCVITQVSMELGINQLYDIGEYT